MKPNQKLAPTWTEILDSAIPGGSSDLLARPGRPHVGPGLQFEPATMLQLVERCPACRGEGCVEERRPLSAPHRGPCEACGRTGVRVTMDGAEVLRLLAAVIDRPIRQEATDERIATWNQAAAAEHAEAETRRIEGEIRTRAVSRYEAAQRAYLAAFNAGQPAEAPSLELLVAAARAEVEAEEADRPARMARSMAVRAANSEFERRLSRATDLDGTIAWTLTLPAAKDHEIGARLLRVRSHFQKEPAEFEAVVERVRAEMRPAPQAPPDAPQVEPRSEGPIVVDLESED